MTLRKLHSLLLEAANPDPCGNERQEYEQIECTKDKDVVCGLKLQASDSQLTIVFCQVQRKNVSGCLGDRLMEWNTPVVNLARNSAGILTRHSSTDIP